MSPFYPFAVDARGVPALLGVGSEEDPGRRARGAGGKIEGHGDPHRTKDDGGQLQREGGVPG
jgi:hypothetical protein